MFLQRWLVRMPLLVAASAWTEILRASEKDIVVSKNANVSEETALSSEHNGENFIFLAHLIPLLGQFLNEQGKTFRFIPQWREKEWERELERGKGIEWRDLTMLCYDLTGWLPWCKSRENIIILKQL